MSKCELCESEMLDAKGCVEVPFRYADGKIMKPIVFGNESEQCYPEPASADEEVRCHDCNCLLGQFHHTGCDVERCPRCNGQAISCGCELEDEDDCAWKNTHIEAVQEWLKNIVGSVNAPLN